MPTQVRYNKERNRDNTMRISPKYPKEILNNPFYAGIIVGYLLAIGISIIFFIDFFYGLGLISIGITYYYIKHGEFNKEN